MDNTLFESLDDLIEKTQPSFRSAAKPFNDDLEVCGAPVKIGRMFELREKLKRANLNGVTHVERAVNLLRLDRLDKKIREDLILCVMEKAPTFLDEKDPLKLRATQQCLIIYRNS